MANELLAMLTPPNDDLVGRLTAFWNCDGVGGPSFCNVGAAIIDSDKLGTFHADN